MTEEPQGLLLVFGECGPKVTEEEFSDWYDNELAPARLTVPGFISALRYKAVRTAVPNWLAMYDTTDPSTVQTEAYKALRTNASDNEASVVSRSEMLDLRVYKRLSTWGGTDVTQLPGKYVLTVCIGLHEGEGSEIDAEFNKWYEEEHMELISRVPGWKRGRRYKLVDWTELGGGASKEAKEREPARYLAVHEWDRDGFMDTAEFAFASSTPWTTKIRKSMAIREVGSFKLYKDFKK
ncbi:hypothetical protein BD779DRAFT_611826 [Infundibulicybe gibba]|nr:hypothetical protein BD779DRAFT_611826 [Infundibulicybe gibba]